jgi:hypothetical protein
LPHPVIAQWFKLALTNDLEDAHNKIREFTEKTLRALKIPKFDDNQS